MVRWIGLVAGLTAGLAGCANAPPLVDRLGADRVRGDADRVSVEGDRLDALPLAVAHCSHYSRSARFARMQDGRSVFDCVGRP